MAAKSSTKQITTAPNKGGRPTKYRPEMCELVVKLGESGKSQAQMSMACGIDTAQFWRWQDMYPPFRAAVKLALERSLAYWEEMGERGCWMGKDFNAVTYIFIMKNRFKEHYADAKQLELGDSFMKTWQAISEGKKSQPKAIEHSKQETSEFRSVQKVNEVST